MMAAMTIVVLHLSVSSRRARGRRLDARSGTKSRGRRRAQAPAPVSCFASLRRQVGKRGAATATPAQRNRAWGSSVPLPPRTPDRPTGERREGRGGSREAASFCRWTRTRRMPARRGRAFSSRLRHRGGTNETVPGIEGRARVARTAEATRPRSSKTVPTGVPEGAVRRRSRELLWGGSERG